MLRILFGLALLAGGVLMTLNFERVFRAFGRVAWVEKYIGTGESRLFYQAFGFILALIGMVIMLNLHTKFLISVLGPLFGSL